MSQVTRIGAQAFLQQHNTNQHGDDCAVVDVRTSAEVRAEPWLAAVVHAPIQELTSDTAPAKIPNGVSTVYLLCQSGRRAEMAAEVLSGCHSAQCVIVEGGVEALKAAGAPIQSAQGGVMSLERQVRIVAGGLVFASVVAGFLLTPTAFFLAGFVGAGLVFAGVTNTCAMGLLIARMPWNR